MLVAGIEPSPVDAIIVPSSRSSEYLTTSIDLARATGTYILALCSGESSPQDALRRLSAANVSGGVIAMESVEHDHPLVDGFETDTFPEARFGRETNDLSRKRNVSLLIAHLAGWEKIFFLDDDIKISAEQFRKVAGALANNAIAGFTTTDFPDNSVVRHAQRLGGTEPYVYMSGGALGVNAREAVGFFPNIYNEDWFFMICNWARRKNLGEVVQRAYDPFEDSQRALSEEFGDLLAEGLMPPVGSGVPFTATGEAGWEATIKVRKDSVSNICNSLIAPSPVSLIRRFCALSALGASSALLDTIQPKRCQQYIEAWLSDIELHQERLVALPTDLSVAEATEELGLKSAFTCRARDRDRKTDRQSKI